MWAVYKEELLEYLKQNYNDILDTINLSIISENFSRNYTAAETGLVINFDEMTEEPGLKEGQEANLKGWRQYSGLRNILSVVNLQLMTIPKP